MKFAVVIPKFNHADYYRQTVDSLLAQSVPPDLIVLSEGNSNDGSREEALALALKYPGRIITTSAPPGADLSQNHMHGLSLVPDSIDYTAFLASDDFWHSSFIENISHYLSIYQSVEPINCIYSGALMIDRLSIPCSASGGWSTQSLFGFEDAFKYHLRGCKYLFSGAFFKTSFLKANVELFQSCAQYLDWILILEAARKGYLVFCPLHLLRYRLDSSVTRFYSDKSKDIPSVLSVYYQFLRAQGDEIHAKEVGESIQWRQKEAKISPVLIDNRLRVTKLNSSIRLLMAKFKVLHWWRLIQVKYSPCSPLRGVVKSG